ncbi:MAG: hypothetical protein ABI333_21095 [bacterium]
MKKFGLLFALIFAFAMVGCGDDDASVDCVDNDGDGYGEGVDCTDTDCDDNDETVWAEMDGYADSDGDGVNSDTAETLCTDGTLPSGYSATAGDDCDDDDGDVSVELEGYVDNDGDGVGAGTAETFCTDGTLPTGYAETGTDCDDASALIFELMTGYPDFDGDMVAADTAMDVCSNGTDLPDGYMDTAGTDCDDFDKLSQTDATGLGVVGCGIPGTCVDSELFQATPVPDFYGIGGCLGVDCNGAQGGNTEPVIPTTTSCSSVNDCNNGELCFAAGDPLNPAATGKVCWNIPGNCVQDNAAGLTCSELIECNATCKVVHEGDSLNQALCMQFSCFEGSTSLAQYIWGWAQDCAAPAGCFGTVDATAMEDCATDNCMLEFANCIGHAP